MAECKICEAQATRVLVDYHHEVIEDGHLFCEDHATVNGQELCPCCYDYVIEVFDEDTGEEINLLPTYGDGVLDNEGCCSDHP